MLGRTGNPKNKDYKHYGARGITVCDMWKDSFEAFLMSMGSAPGPGYTIERKEVNGNYEPGNCVWATRKEQSRNRTSNVQATLNGKTQTVSEWIEELGIENPNYIYKRLSRNPDMSPEEAITKPRK